MWYSQEGLYVVISSGGGHAEEKFTPDRVSRAVAELLELFLPSWRGDLHLNKPGISPGSDGGDGPSVVTSKRKAGSICQVSSLLRFYYPVYRPHPPPPPPPPCPSLSPFSDRLFYTRRLADLLIYIRVYSRRRQRRDQLLMHFYWAIIPHNLNPSMDPQRSARHHDGYIADKADVVSTWKHEIKGATMSRERRSDCVM